MYVLPIPERVDAGMEALDAYYNGVGTSRPVPYFDGGRWVLQIDPDLLRIESPQWCVLGQLTSERYGAPGDAYGHPVWLNMTTDEREGHGFDAAIGNGTGSHLADCKRLEHAWRERIEARRASILAEDLAAAMVGG